MVAPPANGDEDPPEKQKNAVQAAIGIAGGLLALGAYVYLLGGFVLWLKFTAARLPTDNAVGALGGNRLLAVGLKALVFELVLIGALLGLAFLAWEAVRFRDVKAAKKNEGKAKKEIAEEERTGEHRLEHGAEQAMLDAEKAVADAAVLNTTEKWEAWRKLLQALIVGILAGCLLAEALRPLWSTNPWPWLCLWVGVLAASLWLLLLPGLLSWTDKRRGRRRALKTWLTVIAAVLGVAFLAAPAGVGVLVLLLFLHLSHFLKELHKVSDPIHLIPAVLIVAGGLSLVVATYLATPPVALDNTLIVMEGRAHHTIRGGYVGRSSDGVYLAACVPDGDDPTESETTHLRVIAPEAIRRIVFGGRSDYVLDDGEDPSLLDVGRYVISQGSLGEGLDTVSLDVRESELTCGFPRVLTIGKRPRDRHTGRQSQQATVPDDGILTLYGDGLKPQRIETDVAGNLSLPIAPRPDVRMAHRCEGPFKARLRVAFKRGDGVPESKDATVTLTSATGTNRLEQARACHRAWVHQGRIAAPLPVAAGSNAR